MKYINLHFELTLMFDPAHARTSYDTDQRHSHDCELSHAQFRLSTFAISDTISNINIYLMMMSYIYSPMVGDTVSILFIIDSISPHCSRRVGGPQQTQRRELLVSQGGVSPTFRRLSCNFIFSSCFISSCTSVSTISSCTSVQTPTNSTMHFNSDYIRCTI
jgi:hypothetical protein